MNKVGVHLKQPISNYMKLSKVLASVIQSQSMNYSTLATDVDIIDAFTTETINEFQRKAQQRHPLISINQKAVQYFIKNEPQSFNIESKNMEDLEKYLIDLSTSTKKNNMGKLIKECLEKKKFISKSVLRKLLNTYSSIGKVETVEILLNYCSIVISDHYNNSGKFLHYLGKAQCIKGNMEKGLSLIKECYITNIGLRSVYRMVIRELIHDSVLNKSEATLVTIKKHVLDYSNDLEEHYPIICLWHVCWVSSWFSDQKLADELLDSSEKLRNIIKEKSTTFSISVLRHEDNEDAVIRLLQTLLKYSMKDEYVKVLEVLFSYKLRNHDLRGCREIIRNCELLEMNLSPILQEEFIHLIITGSAKPRAPLKLQFKDFKLKF